MAALLHIICVCVCVLSEFKDYAAHPPASQTHTHPQHHQEAHLMRLLEPIPAAFG